MGWFGRFLALLLIPSLFPMAPAAAEPLKIATWNLAWLTMRQPGASGLPADVTPRAPDDFARLRAYAIELDADLVALQEIDSFDAARAVFPPEQYVLHLTRDRLAQKVGVAVRRGLRHHVNPDVPLSPDPAYPTRAGFDLTLTASGLRVVVVHLKQGCRDPARDRAATRDCAILLGQAEPLKRWLTEREAERTPFAVLGDFNRWMDGRDRFLAELRRAAPLTRATEGFNARCWTEGAFIDHILLGGRAMGWLQPNSLRVFRYRETGPGWMARLSDHCPVSVWLDIP